MPLQTHEWEEVKVRFDVKYAERNRAVSSLQGKFNRLYHTKEPTGDPHIPSPVLSAQALRK